MEQNINEIRNLQLINMKRLGRLEKLYENLVEQNLDNHSLLEIIRNDQMNSENNDDFFNPRLFEQIFQTDLDNLDNIYLEEESLDTRKDIEIPQDFFSRN